MDTRTAPSGHPASRSAGRRGTPAALRMPLVVTGVAMAAYLALRPYGDHGATLDREAAGAFASPWWIAAHLGGVLALASFARVALRVDDLVGGVAGQVARWSALVGLVLVLPYYGAETFGLHAIGTAVMEGGPTQVGLADDVRNQPVALSLFTAGLVLLAVSAVASGLAWRGWVVVTGGGAGRGRAAWPLVAAVVLFAAQFLLPPVGRVAFAVAYLGAALGWAVAVARVDSREAEAVP